MNEEAQLELMRKAVKAFRKMQPMLTAYARAVTGNPKVRVVLSSSSAMTDGTNIFFRPPLALGQDIIHDRRLCDKRDPESSVQLCKACAVREEVYVNIFHEIGHIAYDSFAKAGDYDKEQALLKAAEEMGEKYRDALVRKFKGDITDSYLGLSNLINPYLHGLYSAVEDARVDGRMFDARPGIRTMMQASNILILKEGTDPYSKGTVHNQSWMDAPLNAQAAIACLYRIDGYRGWEPYLNPDVVAHTGAPNVQAVLDKLAKAKSVEATFRLTLPLMEELRKHGYFKKPEEIPVDPPPPDNNDEASSDGSQSGDGESNENQADDQDAGDSGSPGGSKSDENSGDNDDSASSGDSDSQQSDNADDSSSGSNPSDGGESTNSGSKSGSSEQASDSDSGSTGEDSNDEGSDEVDGEEGSSSGGDQQEDSEPGDDSGGGHGQDSSESSEGGEGDEGESSGGGDESDSDLADDRGDSGSEGDVTETDDSNGDGQSAGAGGEQQSDGDTGSDDADLSDGTGADGDSGDGTDGDRTEDSESDESDGEEEGAGSDPSDEDDTSGSEVPEGDQSDERGDDRSDLTESDSNGDGQAGEDASTPEDPTPPPPDHKHGTDGQPCECGYCTTYGGSKSVEQLIQQVHEAVASLQQDDNEVDPFGGADTDHDFSTFIDQSEFMDTPSTHIDKVYVHKPGDRDGAHFFRNEPDDTEVPESALGGALLHARKAFSDNMRGTRELNLRSGSVNARALGRRAWQNDPRLFQKRRQPGRKDYSVLIGIDLSSSTNGELHELIRLCALAQADMLHRLGIRFAVYGHSGNRYQESSYYGGQKKFEAMDIIVIKEFSDPWSTDVRNVMKSVRPHGANLDGHTLEYYRKRLDEEHTTTRILMYYTDGFMPYANKEEELDILEREIKMCKKLGYTLMGVEVGDRAHCPPELDTCQVYDTSDLRVPVKHLEKRLAES